MTVHGKSMAWRELTHLSEVTLPAPEGPFTQLVASDREGRALTLCATFTAPPSPESTAATLAGNVSVSKEQLEEVRQAVCAATGFDLLEMTPQGPVYGKLKEPVPLTAPREW